jgi:hypothetical protein
VSYSFPHTRKKTIPQTFVVAADGHVVAKFRGYDDSIPQMLRHSIERALDPAFEPPPRTPFESPPPRPSPSPSRP